MPSKFTVIRDSREQAGHGWSFIKTDRCAGTVIEALKTGDYTLKGHESSFIIERKSCASELAGNLFQDRFWAELERLSKFEHPYIVLEFPFEQLEQFPRGSGIPWAKARYIKAKGPLLLKRFHEMRLSFPNIRTEFVGKGGRPYCLSLFKRIVDGGEPADG